jgi:hypothetical protein
MSSQAPARVWNPSKLVIAGILAIGLAAALFSQWYHRQSGRRALELWGAEPARLIAQAPKIEALVLEPANAPAAAQSGEDQPGEEALLNEPIERLGVGGRFYLVTSRRDATGAQGISNIRRAIVMDGTYEWGAPKREEKPQWQYALEFHEDGRTAKVLFDFDSGQIGSTTGNRTAVLDPAAVDNWRSFFEE